MNCTVCSLQHETWHSVITTYEYYIITNDKVLSIFGCEMQYCLLCYIYILKLIILSKLIFKKCVTLIYNSLLSIFYVHIYTENIAEQ